MAISKNIKVAGGFVAPYHHIDRIDWNKQGGIATIYVSGYKDKESSASGVAAHRSIITAPFGAPPTQAQAYEVIKEDGAYRGAFDA